MSRKQEGNGPKVPAYIVTFSDMITLLLTFFVMLLSLASVQDPELCNRSRDSFVLSLQYFGLGLLMGNKITPGLEEVKTKYFINESEKTVVVRTIDAREEDVRRMFRDVTRTMKAMPTQALAEQANFSVTNLRFAPGGTVLDKSARSFLKRFAGNLQQAGSRPLKLYVLGLANDVKGEKKQWLVSAKRAKAVSDFLSSSLPPTMHCPVYSWGGGSGGKSASMQSQISIAVLR